MARLRHARGTIPRYFLVVLFTFFSACFWDEPYSSNVGGPQGNGAGYGGGDKALTYARKLLKLGLSQYRDGMERTAFGDFNAGCLNLNEPILCNLLIGLAPLQKEYLQTFMANATAQMLALNTGSTKVVFEFTDDSLNLVGADGTSRDLSAITKLGPEGSILFHADTVHSMNDWQRLQLITHEFGHKVVDVVAGYHFIADDGAIGPFPTGTLFLDTLGAAMATYLAGHVGKTAVLFPDPNSSCDTDSLNLMLLAAPYFKRPPVSDTELDGDTSGLTAGLNGPGGQVAEDMRAPLNTIDAAKGDFTLAAWIKFFDDLDQSDATYSGQVMFSNISFDSDSWFGLELFRLDDGHFGVYGGINEVLDSGVELVPGGFHLVALKRTGGKLYTSVDGVVGNSGPATYFSETDAQDIVAGIVDALEEQPPTIGKGARYPGRSGNQLYRRLDFWKGHIASISLYSQALSDDQIRQLHLCAPSALTAATPTTVTPNPIPSPQVNGSVTITLLHNNILYIAGSFNQIGGKARPQLAAINVDTGEITDWNPVASSDVQTMAISDDGMTVYVGGNFYYVGGEERHFLAAVDATGTGAVKAWNPAPSSEVDAIAVRGNTVYVGGRFTEIAGQSKSYLAALSATDGSLITAWDPAADNIVRGLLVSPDGNTIYARGDFTSLGRDGTLSYAGAVNATNGDATGWKPNVDYDVLTMVLSGSTMYLGGYFSEVGGVARNGIAAVDSSTGALITTWNPNATDYTSVKALALSGTTLYVGGGFTNIGGQARAYIAALDAVTANSGNATNWNPSPDGDVYAIAVSGTTIFAGGYFSSIGGKDNPYFSAITEQGTAP